MKLLLLISLTSIHALHAACAEKSNAQNLVAAPTEQAIVERAIARNSAAAQATAETKAEQAIILDNPSQQHLDFYAIIAALRHQPQHPADKTVPIQQQDTADKVLIDLIGEYTSEMIEIKEYRLLALLPHQQLLIQSIKQRDRNWGDYPIKIYDVKSKQEIRTLPIICDVSQGIALSDGTIALCNRDNLMIIDVKTDTVLQKFAGERAYARKLYELSSNKLLIIGGDGMRRGTIIRDLLTGSKIQTFITADMMDSTAVFNNGSFILPCTSECLKIYNSQGEVTQQLQLPAESCAKNASQHEIITNRSKRTFKSVAMLANDTIATASVCGSTIHIWNQVTGRVLSTLNHVHPGSNKDEDIEFLSSNLPGNKLLAIGDTIINIWDMNTRKIVKTYIAGADYFHRFLDQDFDENIKVSITTNNLIISSDKCIAIITDPTLEKCLR